MSVVCVMKISFHCFHFLNVGYIFPLSIGFQTTCFLLADSPLTSPRTLPAARGSGGKGPSGIGCADPDVGGEGHRDARFQCHARCPRGQ